MDACIFRLSLLGQRVVLYGTIVELLSVVCALRLFVVWGERMGGERFAMCVCGLLK